MAEIPGVLQLPDDQLMLALCVREENLTDPAKWCRELRACWLEKSKQIRDAVHAERLMEWSERLSMEAAGKRPQSLDDDFGPPVYELGPEDAAFLSYELAVKALSRS